MVCDEHAALAAKVEQINSLVFKCGLGFVCLEKEACHLLAFSDSGASEEYGSMFDRASSRGIYDYIDAPLGGINIDRVLGGCRVLHCR